MLQQRFKPRFIAPLGNDSVIAAAVGSQANTGGMDWGDHEDLAGGIRVHLEPSYHWSARGALDRRKQLWGSFVIETTAGKLYHIGDTGYIDGQYFRDVKAKHGAIKLAMIPIGAYEPRWFMQQQHVNPEDAVKIMQDCGAEIAIGHHWGTFQLTNEAIDDPPKDLAVALLAAKIEPDRFQPFRPGQSLSLRTAA
jgi:L-ascorbate metabolism protein UlaG (beta-lactamase superfamily)